MQWGQRTHLVQMWQEECGAQAMAFTQAWGAWRQRVSARQGFRLQRTSQRTVCAPSSATGIDGTLWIGYKRRLGAAAVLGNVMHGPNVENDGAWGICEDGGQIIRVLEVVAATN